MDYTTQMDAARKNIITPEMEKVAAKEKMDVEVLRDLIAKGQVIIITPLRIICFIICITVQSALSKDRQTLFLSIITKTGKRTVNSFFTLCAILLAQKMILITVCFRVIQPFIIDRVNFIMYKSYRRCSWSFPRRCSSFCT